MRHARADYMRFQEPEPLLEIVRRFYAFTETDGRMIAKGIVKDARQILEWYDSLPPVVSPIAEDEPVFLMRAKDRFMPSMLAVYEELCRMEDSDLADGVAVLRRVVAEWQGREGCKTSDLPQLELPLWEGGP